MRGFYQLQSLFAAQTATAIGLTPSSMNVYQAAQLPPADSDEFLWALLNQIPGAGPVQSASGSATFFDAYATVINALVAGSNPLDAVAAAKRNLAAWGADPPAWTRGYKSMAKQLGAAPRLEFSFSLRADEDPPVWGLWRDAEAVEGPSARFAAGPLNMKTAFGRLLNFAPQASDWYTPSAMSLAYHNPGKAPWDQNSPVNWESTFGEDGSLNRVVTGLICVKDIRLSYESEAAYPDEDQAQITAGSTAGLWPYYLNEHSAATQVAFDRIGTLAASVDSSANTPVVIGVVTQSAARFFGGQ